MFGKQEWKRIYHLGAQSPLLKGKLLTPSSPGPTWFRHEICQNFYTTRFSGQKFYTQKVQKLGLVLLTKKQQECINISNLSNFC